jgi:hypothetical protein
MLEDPERQIVTEFEVLEEGLGEVLGSRDRDATAEAEAEGERVMQRRKKVFQEVPGVQLERTENDVQLGPTRTVEGHQGEFVVPQATELFEKSATAPPLLPAVA